MHFSIYFKFIFILCVYFSTYSEALNITLDGENDIEEKDLKSCFSKSNPTFSGSVQDVYIGVLIVNIDQIREDSMEFRLHCYLYTKWTNRRLNITVVNRAFPVELPEKLTDCMWKPDIYFPNSLDIKTFDAVVPNKGHKLTESGEILRFERFMFRISCPMQFSLYPFDSQHCSISIGLMRNTDSKVLLHWDESIGNHGLGLYYEMKPLEFRISKPEADYHTEEWVTGNYTVLRGNITFHRLLTGSFLNFYMPSSLVVVLSWVSFYIDVEAAPARVTLSVTALLTISTQMIQSRTGLPPVQYITSMDVWMFFCLSLIFAAIMEFSIAYSFRLRLKKNTLLSHKPQQIEVSTVPEKKSASWRVEPEVKKKLKDSGNSTCQSVKNNPEKLDLISRKVFPLFMICFTVTYFSILLAKTEITLS